jgi:tetratricopeptide (TPR) repeat protein
VRARWTGVAAAVLLAALPRGLVAQRPAGNPIQQAFELERRGDLSGAAAAYRALLAGNPADLTALLGLERCLTASGRVEEMIPEVRTALASAPAPTLYLLALRVWADAGLPDSMRTVAERWAATETDREVPYRAWGDLLLQRRDLAGARRAYTAGREAVGRPEILSAELAQVAQLEGDFVAAAREWLLAQRLSPGYRGAAVAGLAQAPARQRDEVRRALAEPAQPEGLGIAALVALKWDDPAGGVELLRRALTLIGPRGGADLATQFTADVRALGTVEARRALGEGLELLAERRSGAPAARTRLEAARAYAEAGEVGAARRMLDRIAGDTAAGGELAAQAARTLFEVQLAEGALADAAATLAARGAAFPVEDRAAMRLRLARGWMRQGRLDESERLVAGDSTVEGLAVAGRVALLRGRLAAARELFRLAGPFAGTRGEATARTALLALIQPIRVDSLPALGEAFVALERGDTTGAVTALDQVAGALPPAEGGASLALYAAELTVALGGADGERRLRAVAASGIPATAAAAELDLGRLLVALGRPSEAVAQLEHLILTYPGSALLPEARRLLDRARGAVPAT